MKNGREKEETCQVQGTASNLGDLAGGGAGARSWHAKDFGFYLEHDGSYHVLYREIAFVDSSFRNGQSLGWIEANSEPSAAVGKLLDELNEERCFPNRGGGTGWRE